MTGAAVYIVGMGIVSSLGLGLDETTDALINARRALTTSIPFPIASPQHLPVGAVSLAEAGQSPPRTHRLARLAADQALAGCETPPDAIVLGSTTGGILTTESLFGQKIDDPRRYGMHALGSVAEDLARRSGCTGPVVTVSTACSSGAVAIKLAVEMLRCGLARCVLAGGADSLCRLTYFGFNALQLIDPDGARPLDRDRRGMSVAEGAAMLLLSLEPGDAACPQIIGAGLSCDAYHATTPHPEGAGAMAAMQAALDDAGISVSDIDYINLHGTGTIDNDMSEARAVKTLFVSGLPPASPPASSIKGATGHPLAAAGALEAVVAALSIERGFIPANVGHRTIDPALGIAPVTSPLKRPVTTVLSNSFGFGGNNASLIVSRTSRRPDTSRTASGRPGLTIVGRACLTGTGLTDETRRVFFAGYACRGLLADGTLAQGLAPRLIRRLKRLPQMALSLAVHACNGVDAERMPVMVSFGTAWGALSETHDFLERLTETGQQYPSPTDFIGSVHNAPAGQIAMLLGAKGANVTTSGGDYSFEQALLAAELLTRQTADPIFVAAADEHHPVFSPLFDASVRLATQPADGGGGLLLQRRQAKGATCIDLVHYGSGEPADGMKALIQALGGAAAMDRRFGAVMVGLPAGRRKQAQRQLNSFLELSRFQGAMIDYRRLTGEFGGASAVASVLATEMVARGGVPGPLVGGTDQPLNGKGMLVLGLGDVITAIRIFPS